MADILILLGYCVATIGWLWSAFTMFQESKLLGILGLFFFPIALIISIMPNSIDIPNIPFIVIAVGVLLMMSSLLFTG